MNTRLKRHNIRLANKSWCDQTNTYHFAWIALGRPNTVDLILVPHTTKLARKLLAAVRCKSDTDVRTCLKQGQDPNYHYAEGRTALCHASSAGTVAVMDVLLDGGADPNLCGWWSPVHRSPQRNRLVAMASSVVWQVEFA